MSILDMLPESAASASAIDAELARDGGPDIGSLERREEVTLAGDKAREGLMLALDRSDGTSEDVWLRSRGAISGLDAMLPILFTGDGNAGTGGGGPLDGGSTEGKSARLSCRLQGRQGLRTVGCCVNAFPEVRDEAVAGGCGVRA